jgi:hypothetical protein
MTMTEFATLISARQRSSGVGSFSPASLSRRASFRDRPGEPDEWAFFLLHNTPSAFLAIGGAYSQAESTALRDCLVNQG